MSKSIEHPEELSPSITTGAGPNSPPIPSTAPTFWFAERGFENSLTPCICMDNPTGGDPLIIAQIVPSEYWKTYVHAMCDAATRCFRMAEELSQFMQRVRECPSPHGCPYCEEFGCPRQDGVMISADDGRAVGPAPPLNTDEIPGTTP